MHIFVKSIAIILVTLMAVIRLYGNMAFSREDNSNKLNKEEEERKNKNLFDSSAFSSSFNNGQYQYIKDGIRIFAKKARDPGVYFETLIKEVENHKYFIFEIKGKIDRLGQWCFPVVQVYDSKDDDYTPSITKTSFTFKDNEYSTIIVPLEGKVSTISKIQFMLVTDRGSWDVDIINAHFE